MVGGLTIQGWFAELLACHNLFPGMGSMVILQWCWPDGGNYYQQSSITVQVFELLKSTAMEVFSSKED